MRFRLLLGVVAAFAVASGPASAATPRPRLLERAIDPGLYSLAGNTAGDRIVAVPNQYVPRLDVFSAAPGAAFGTVTHLKRRLDPIFDIDAAVAPDGTAGIVGKPVTPAGYVAPSVVALVRPPGGSFAPAEVLTRGQAEEPAVAFDGQGNAIALWVRYSQKTAVNFVEESTRPAGGGWSAPVLISREPRGANTPQVAFDAAGDAIAIWGRERSPIEGQLRARGRRPRRARFNAEIVAAVRPAGRAFGAPQAVSDPRRDTEEASLSVGASGEAVIVWNQDTASGDRFRVGGAFRQAGQPFGGHQLFTPARLDATAPSIALDDQGRSLLTWRLPFNRPDPELSAFRIDAAVRPAGGPIGRSRALSGTRANFSEIAITPSGEGVLSWLYEGSYGGLVQARRATTAGRFGPIVQISPRGGVDNLQTIIDATGRATFVWTRDGRHAQRLETRTLAAP